MNHVQIYLYAAIILLVIPLVNAQELSENPELDLAFSIGSDIILQPQTSSAAIDSVKAAIEFFPINDAHQKIITLAPQSNPAATITQEPEEITFSWKNPGITTLRYSIEATVHTTNTLSAINTPIHLPLTNLPLGIAGYTQPTQFIDLNPAIEQQARSIVGSETDLWKVLFKLADWTKNNVHYNLTTLTAEVVQPSSWVLANRKGVCDEITNLFISMTRSLGIPARFISGTTYSTSDNQWSAHGWAEVYFPNYGWVPFDVTFGQYGWIDATHLKLKESSDSGSPSASYSWKAHDVEVKIEDLKLITTLKSASQKSMVSPLNIKVTPVYTVAQFGSVVPIQVEVTNTANTYLSTSLLLRKAPSTFGSAQKEILLVPKQTQTAYFLVQIPAEGNPKYLYTTEVEVRTSFGDSANASIHFGSDYPFHSKEQALQLTTQHELQQQKPLFTDLTFSCQPEQPRYYRNENITVHCTLSSPTPKQIHACVALECQDLSLIPGLQKPLSITLPARDSVRLQAVAEDAHNIQFAPLDITVIDIPSFYITGLNPKEIDYHAAADVTFMLNADAYVSNLTVIVGNGVKPLVFPSISGRQEISVKGQGAAFMNGLKLTLSYLDAAGKSYHDEITLALKITNVPWYAKLIAKIKSWF